MTGVPLPPGPVMVDLRGGDLEPDEREILTHPAVGGVILFSRNYHDPDQLSRLVAAIHAVRDPHLLVGVDHEGGRVQRFRTGFTRLPPMGALGKLWDADPKAAHRLAHDTGLILALELRAHGIDFTFAPVLDLDHGRSQVIGDRAFHRDPYAVAELATSLVAGLGEGGMGSVGKHFPGHGYAEADSHVDTPVDGRVFEQIAADDLIPFQHLVSNGLTAVMPAHVVYPAVDSLPAGYSQRWLGGVLRERLGFRGAIFSDDLSMLGAQLAGTIVERGRAALAAGCDMVLVCNDSSAARRLVEGLDARCTAPALLNLARLRGRTAPADGTALSAIPRYAVALETLARWRDHGRDSSLA